MSPKPISEASTVNLGCFRVVIFVIGAMFILIGGLCTFFFTILPAYELIDSKGWKEATCKITSSKVERHSGEDTTYSPELEYTFEVDGKTYNADRYNFIDWSSSNRSYAKDIVDSHPVGSEHTCFYDPDDPSTAVLDREFSWMMLLGLIPLVFVIIGPFLIWGVFTNRILATTPTDKSLSLAGELCAFDDKTGTPDYAKFEGPQKLRPEQTRMTRVVIIGFFAPFWNGFVTLFLTLMMQDNPGIFLYLFLIPFVLVGIGLITFFIHQLLSLFNPSVEIALSNGAVPLGETVDIAWQLEGKVSRIRKLTVTIEGTENATYRQGTSTYTDTEVFQTITVVETNSAEEMKFGSMNLTIPPDTIHSFQGNNNSIIWNIKVAGEIPMWPDVDETFPFRIKPHTQA